MRRANVCVCGRTGTEKRVVGGVVVSGADPGAENLIVTEQKSCQPLSAIKREELIRLT